MVNDLSSKFEALLAKEKQRFDRTLGKDLRELRANYGSDSNTVLLMQQRYEADIEERLSTLLATLKRLLSSAPKRDVREGKPELDRLAQVWLQSHIDDCQSQLNEHAKRVSPDQYDLGRARFLNALAVELDLLNSTAPSVLASAEWVVDPVISVFISHSHQDVDLVKLLIDLLRSALNLPSSQIRATSVDGFRLPGGANTTEQLRFEVQSAKVLVGIISQASLKSAYVTFELGARWGSGKPMIPLLTPDVGPESLAGPLQGINALSCRSSAQLHQFVEEMAGHLNVALDRPAAYQKCVDDIRDLQSGLTSIPSDGSSLDALPLRLSDAARDLLLAATRDENGVVIRSRTATGLHITTNQIDFVADRDPKTEARWYEALDELIKSGFVQDRNGKGNVFWLTSLGYSEADTITSEAPNTGPQPDGTAGAAPRG
jgi:hypothetical protein